MPRTATTDDPCAGLTGAELRHCLIIQFGGAVQKMCDANLLTDEEAAGLRAIANGLAMERVPDAANLGDLLGTNDPQGGAA